MLSGKACGYKLQYDAYVLGNSLEVDFILETVQLLVENHGFSLEAQTLIHSRQGLHYTSKKFRQRRSPISMYAERNDRQCRCVRPPIPRFPCACNRRFFPFYPAPLLPVKLPLYAPRNL